MKMLQWLSTIQLELTVDILQSHVDEVPLFRQMLLFDDNANGIDIEAPSGIIFCLKKKKIFFAFPPFRIVLFFSSDV
jgi:hypothetical protein